MDCSFFNAGAESLRTRLTGSSLTDGCAERPKVGMEDRLLDEAFGGAPASGRGSGVETRS